MKYCSKCNTPKELSEFSCKKDTKDGLKSCCKSCDKEYYSGFYTRTKNIRKAGDAHKKQLFIRANKERRLEYFKTHPCVECKNSDPRVLDFHHLRDKECTISRLINCWTRWEVILSEIEKCEVLCANCHRIRHSK